MRLRGRARWQALHHEMDAFEAEGTMKAITELTIAAVAVAFLVAAATQIEHAQARSPLPVAHASGATAATD
jgi:hypothetical protein